MSWTGAAAAHIEIVLPDSRYGPEMIKDAPCGHPDNPPGESPPQIYQTGETVTIVVDEFVAHEGHLRIAWAENDEDIVTINGYDDFNNFPGVLMDNIIDEPGMKQFVFELTMPEQECENCTLQVIQVMYDGDGFQESDLYYTCADITLLDVVPSDEDSGGGMDDAADGSADATGGDDGSQPADTGGGSMGGGTGDGTGAATGGDGAADGGGDDSGCRVGAGQGGRLGWLGLGAMLWLLRRRNA